VPDLFSQAIKVLGEDFTLLVARQEGEITACLALLRSGDDLILKWPGLNYDRTLGTFTYHLIMTESIPKAIEMGVRRLQPGATTYPVKKLMGAVLEDRFLALAMRGPLLHWLMGLSLTLLGKRVIPSPQPGTSETEGL
jgi:hypothetical protein